MIELPIVDMSGVRSGDAQSMARAARDIHAAFTTVGFLYIANHGLPEPVVTDMVREAQGFFHQPLEKSARSRSTSATAASMRSAMR